MEDKNKNKPTSEELQAQLEKVFRSYKEFKKTIAQAEIEGNQLLQKLNKKLEHLKVDQHVAGEIEDLLQKIKNK